MSGEGGGPLVRMVVLGLGVVLLDYSSQAAINPCEALMSDMMAEVISFIFYFYPVLIYFVVLFVF
jgi:hypothetical protein